MLDCDRVELKNRERERGATITRAGVYACGEKLDAREGKAVTVRIVRLGSPRHPDEGLRIGTVRRPPRGVRKSEYSARDLYDVWLPNLAPSEALLKQAPAIGEDERAWRAFVRRYRKEMQQPDCRALLSTLAALSHTANFSVGCYCANEARCHRSVLRELLGAHGAKIEGGDGRAA
jgi:uncharacterized protein YeaO (DUF488 family)